MQFFFIIENINLSCLIILSIYKFKKKKILKCVCRYQKLYHRYKYIIGTYQWERTSNKCVITEMSAIDNNIFNDTK